MLVFATKNMFTPYGLLEIHQYFFFYQYFSQNMVYPLVVSVIRWRVLENIEISG